MLLTCIGILSVYKGEARYMCFSATASFSSGVLLAATAIAAFTKAKNTSQKVLAAIPLIFSLQQFTEGVLWLSLMHYQWQHWRAATTHIFLIFAQAVWPVYIPLSMLLFERIRSRRRIILFLLLTGLALSLYTVYALWWYPQYAFVERHHIRYVQQFALAHQWYYGLLYFLPTIAAPIISSKKDVRWLGYLFLISYAATRLLFHFYEISVWCFFGALISFIVLGIINRDVKSNSGS